MRNRLRIRSGGNRPRFVATGSAFWTTAATSEVTPTLTIKSSDGSNITCYVDYKRYDFVHNTPQAITVPSGTHTFSIVNPTKITSIVNADAVVAVKGTINASAFTSMTELKIRKAAITGATLVAGLTTIELNNNALTAVTLPASAVTVNLANNSLTALDISTCTAITSLNVSTNALVATEIDDIITDIDTAALESGTLNYDSQTGGTEDWSDRSQAARNAQVLLDGKSWTINPATPTATTFWTLAPAGATTVQFTPITSDTEPIYVFWGDGSHEYLTSSSAASHAYSGAGSYALKFCDPTRLTSIIDTDAAKSHLGVIDTSAFDNLATFKIRKSGVTEITIPTDTAITVCEVDGNNLSAGEIDDIITSLDTAGNSSGTLDYDTQDGGTEAWASRSGAAQTAQAALDGKSWTVTPATPAGGGMVFYMKCNDGAYLYDTTGGNTADAGGHYHTSSTGGKFNGYIADGELYDPGIAVQFNNTKADGVMLDWSSPWTMEFFVNANSEGGTHRLTVLSDADNLLQFGLAYDLGGGTIQPLMYVKKAGSTTISVSVTAISISTATWYHGFVSYDGTKMYMGFNGKIVYSTNQATSNFPDMTAKPSGRYLKWYSFNSTGGDKYDNMAVHSECKWTGAVNDDYTPPSAEY